MKRVVVDMHNGLFADAIAQALRGFSSDFDVATSDGPEKTAELCELTSANILIMEVTAFSPWDMDERMKVRGEVKSRDPVCKIVFVVDENSERELAEKVRQAKKDALIDQFVYGSISSTYLAAIMDTL